VHNTHEHKVAVYVCTELISMRLVMAPQACSYARFSAVALCLASLAGLARTQAPHDREQGCLDDSSHPQYDDHVRPLLDTRDYGKLLPYDSDGAGGVWQTLDSDGDGVKWRTPSPVYCNEVVNVCGRSSGHQENWMITQHISVPDNVTTVQVMIDSRLDVSCLPSAPSCVDDLSLYLWETPTQNRLLATNTSNYHFIGNISSGERVIKISPLSQSGFYLGIRDNGTCASVSRVLVYYSVCEAGSEGLVRVDQNTSAGNTLQGHCVENSVSTSDSGPPLLECQESGRWRVVNNCPLGDPQCRAPEPCECQAGYQHETVNDELVCSVCTVGMFSEGGGDVCRPCPGNSNSTAPGMGLCPCLNGYYRPLESESTRTDCILPPDEVTESSDAGLAIGDVIGAIFGSFCAILLIAIAFIVGLILGRHIQRRKINHYDVIPAHSGPMTAKTTGWKSPSRSSSQNLCIPPPLPGERSTRSSREDIRGSSSNVSIDGQAPAPEYAVVQERTPLHGNHNGKSGYITAGKITARASGTEPEYAIPSTTSGAGRNAVHSTHQDKTVLGQNSRNNASVANDPAHEYAILEDPSTIHDKNMTPSVPPQKPFHQPQLPEAPVPVVKIVVQDDDGQETPMEDSLTSTH
jgi:hypothetical protein